MSNEEVDDRLKFHVSYAVKLDGIEAAIVCSGDTDVHTSLMYNYDNHWRHYGLRELWVQHNKKVSPIHESMTHLGGLLVRILPTIHSLTGCDITSKVGTKEKAFKIASNEKYQQQLSEFGERVLGHEMLKYTEEFLLECIGTRESLSRGIITFDSMQHYNFHNEERKDFNIEKLPCTSQSIKLPIERAFLQTHKWINVATTESISFSPLNFEFETDGGTLILQVALEERTPADFPEPCTCLKCARANICLYRMKNILFAIFVNAAVVANTLKTFLESLN